ncbi:hypothetical protein RchiOBHm_Chr2g0167561 [Rosa chinensis]|uniref:At1g61320/AtMIF1 LRR domain-containing protein n=1 Tax=Rosa chinensis TaxID=74649 RepID=A0A2P6S4C3_ROSCH|nr:hypothetical protein RchiOBHm_Chr2g0167561 [Rosa chinensis]
MVSRQWRHLWKHLTLTCPYLVFDIPNIFRGKYNQLVVENEGKNSFPILVRRFSRQCYIKRVNEFLELYSGKKVDSFKVAFFLDGECTEDIDKWVRFAITKGVEVLNLQLFRGIFESDDNLHVFPHWILSELNSSTLKQLSLHRCLLKPPTDFNLFCHLTTLCLSNVVVDSVFFWHIYSLLVCSLKASP